METKRYKLTKCQLSHSKIYFDFTIDRYKSTIKLYVKLPNKKSFVLETFERLYEVSVKDAKKIVDNYLDTEFVKGNRSWRKIDIQ